MFDFRPGPARRAYPAYQEGAAIMSRTSTRLRPAPAGACCLLLVLSAACLPATGRAEAPAAAAKFTPSERAAKLAERDRLSKEAGELRSAGKFDEAIERMGRVIGFERELFGPGSADEAGSLEQIALNERDRQHWPAARRAAAEALAILHSKDDWHTIDARLLAADVDRWEKLTGAQREQLAEADQLIGEAGRLNRQGKYREALEPVQRALAPAPANPRRKPPLHRRRPVLARPPVL